MGMDYEIKHNALMKRWSEKELHKDRDFIADGIIDYSRWNNSNRKILLLLKEAYGDYGNLCWLIRDEWKGPKYKIWWTVSYWLYALQKTNVNSFPIFPTEQSEYDECAEYLLSSAVVNIKKSSGKSLSDHDDIISYAEKDGDLLKEQISLINPDVILCGYTFDSFKTFWEKPLKNVGKTEFVHRSDNCIIINYWHPANQYPDHLCYYGLCAIIQEAKITKPNQPLAADR